MIDLILFVLLVFGVLMGLKRGFILQFFHLTGSIVALVIAMLYYDAISPRLELWVPFPELPADAAWAVFLGESSIENAFYNAAAFLLIFMAVRILLHILASMLDFVAELPVLSSVNKLFGGVLGFVEVYLILFLFLYVGALLPIEFVQTMLDRSEIAAFTIENTPYLSGKIKELWFEHIASRML